MASTYLRFTIGSPDGTQRELSVDADRVTVGTGAHCEIRLAGEDGISVEQLAVEAQGGAVFATALSMTPPPRLNGLPFTRGRLSPTTLLELGRLSLRVECAEAGDRPVVARAQRRKTNPLFWVLGAVGFPLGLYLVLWTRPEPRTLGAPPLAPPLWSDGDGASCAHVDREVARARAASDLEQASARRERSPFSPRDGVESVSLYARAAACFARADDSESAALARAHAQHMRQTTSRQFHVHQVRLERALALREHDAAQSEAQILQTFIGGRGGEYAGWLSDLERSLAVQRSGKQAKKR